MFGSAVRENQRARECTDWLIGVSTLSPEVKDFILLPLNMYGARGDVFLRRRLPELVGPNQSSQPFVLAFGSNALVSDSNGNSKRRIGKCNQDFGDGVPAKENVKTHSANLRLLTKSSLIQPLRTFVS